MVLPTGTGALDGRRAGSGLCPRRRGTGSGGGCDGALLDDFVVQTPPRQAHVLNAPSPAATTALEIARYVAAQLAETLP
jgi:hypothetical protein